MKDVLEYPIYKKSAGIHFYKVYSEEECVQVYNGGITQYRPCITLSCSSLASYMGIEEESNEEEFLEQYNSVIELIKNL